MIDRQVWNRIALTTVLSGAVCIATFVGIGARNSAVAQDAGISANINDYVAKDLQDFTATMHVVEHNDDEGRKINKDFGMIYQLKGDVHVRYKEENKLRMDGRIGPANATFIMNGTKQYVKIPSVGLKSTTNLSDSPGKRKTLLDVGLISSGYLAYTHAEFQGARPVDGVMCAVFRVTYRVGDTSHRILWIDPKTKVTLKHEEYSQKGKLNATFLYKDPVETAPGVWFPSHIVAVNNEGKKAGELAYRDIKVNQGLDDDVFRM